MDNTIVRLLEKLSRAERFLFWNIGKEHGLTPLQIQIIIFLERRGGQYTGVTGIAEEFDLSKPTVSVTIRLLVKKGLVYQVKISRDRRKSHLMLTAKGKTLSRELASWSAGIENELKKFPRVVKETMLMSLMQLITQLKESRIIRSAKTCLSCDNFTFEANLGEQKPHFCTVQEVPVSSDMLRIDCIYHSSNSIH